MNNKKINKEDISQENNSNIPSLINFSYERYKVYSKEASKIARQLAFAEGAIFWTLYIVIADKPKILLISFYSILILFFIIDLSQYLYGAYNFNSKAEQLKKFYNSNLEKNLHYNYGDEIGKKIEQIFVSKIIVLACSIILLLKMLYLYAIS